MIEIKLATKEDYDEYIAFAGGVFSTPEKKTVFPELLPKIYAPGNEKLADNYIAVDESGKIVGLAARSTMEMTAEDTVLKGGYIGTVSVSPKVRGQGIMRSLMEHILSESKKEGFAFLSLDGARQRYGYYGFSPSGERMIVTITKENVLHALKDVKTDGICFTELSEDKDDQAEALRIHETRKVRFDRKSPGFFTIALSFGGKGYLIKNGDEAIGYLIVDKDSGDITDLCLSECRHIQMAIRAWMEYTKSEKTLIHCGIYERDILRELTDIAEKTACEIALKTRILDFKAMIRALLRLKAGYAGLDDGIISLKINDIGITIGVKDNNISVVNGCETDPVMLDTTGAGRYLMDPFAYSLRRDIRHNWFPLPFFIPRADTI